MLGVFKESVNKMNNLVFLRHISAQREQRLTDYVPGRYFFYLNI